MFYGPRALENRLKNIRKKADDLDKTRKPTVVIYGSEEEFNEALAAGRVREVDVHIIDDI